MCDAFGCDRNVFGIEAVLRIVPTVRIDFVALVKPADVDPTAATRPDPSVPSTSGKYTSPSGDQPARMSASHEPAPAVCSAISTSPTSGTGTGSTWIIGDFRSTELVDRGRSHGVRNGAHIMFLSNDEAYESAVHAERRPRRCRGCRRGEINDEVRHSRAVPQSAGSARLAAVWKEFRFDLSQRFALLLRQLPEKLLHALAAGRTRQHRVYRDGAACHLLRQTTRHRQLCSLGHPVMDHFPRDVQGKFV